MWKKYLFKNEHHPSPYNVRLMYVNKTHFENYPEFFSKNLWNISPAKTAGAPVERVVNKM